MKPIVRLRRKGVRKRGGRKSMRGPVQRIQGGTLAAIFLLNSAVAGEENWWSLQPMKPVSAPPCDSHWARNEIDRFIESALLDRGLSPSPEADRRTLIRRLSYDLIGLPPTPEEFEAFEDDLEDGAFERLVERLLDSPRYGERWARHWLDVVHFGETHGYDKDKLRPNAWPYRDYVIRSFNEDKPYARFIEEQLAGDVLYPDTPVGFVATGFIAAGPWDYVGHVELREGTIDKEITRNLDRDDMVTTAMSTFSSMTVHCARCHDHKFDPIPQKDYYALQAVFAGVDRAEREYDHDPATLKERHRLHSERAMLQNAVRSCLVEIEQARADSSVRAIDERIARLQRSRLDSLPVTGEPFADPAALGFHSEIRSSPLQTEWVEADLGQVVPLDAIILIAAHESYGGHPGPGFGFPHRFKVEVREASDSESTVIAGFTGLDYPNPGDVPIVLSGAGRPARFIKVTATELWKRTDDWIFALGELLVLSQGRNVAASAPVISSSSIEALPRWGRQDLVDGEAARQRWRVPAAPGESPTSKVSGRPPAGSGAPIEVTSPRASRDPYEHQGAVEQLVQDRHQRLVSVLGSDLFKDIEDHQQRLRAVDEAISRLPPPLRVYAAASSFPAEGSFAPVNGPRPIHVLARGDVWSKGESVRPGALSCVMLPSDPFTGVDSLREGYRRAALARWLTHPENPLTWRSIVNRVWQYHFGRGLVETPNDFGRMGALPSHPELLDWLSLWFRDHGGSIKKLHRLIVSSTAYRQVSCTRAGCSTVDGDNALLWRMNRRRLDAEALHDTVLWIAGRMDLKMGGPSDRQFGFEDDHSPRYQYSSFDLGSPMAQRRAIYRHLVRSVPDPFYECMDCADASLLVPLRTTTLTPQQALVLLNDRFMLEGSAWFAERLNRSSTDAQEQVCEAFARALGREPTKGELPNLLELVKAHGLENLCRAVFNLNEFAFVD